MNLLFQSSDLLYVAGQIGLVPGSMSLISGLESQAELSLRHLRRILEVYNLTTHDIIWVNFLIWLLENLKTLLLSINKGCLLRHC